MLGTEIRPTPLFALLDHLLRVVRQAICCNLYFRKHRVEFDLEFGEGGTGDDLSH